jgi:hypothetical protein
MTRESFMQLCERAADFCDVSKSATITITKFDGETITLTIKDNFVTSVMTKGVSGHQLRELH